MSICPHCKNLKSEILETRIIYNMGAKRRRRVCKKCNSRFTTEEVVVSPLPRNHRKLRTGGRKRVIAEGELNPAAVLTAENVKELRSLASKGISRRDLARKYGISLGHIGRIVTFKSWNCV